jgi:hypothetical protein
MDDVEYRCRACGNVLDRAARMPVRQVPTDLYRCGRCGLYEFPAPDWLDAAYTDPIAAIDVGIAARCLFAARVTEAIVRAEKLGHRRHLDYGGGYGLLTRQLRDRGIDMLHQDPLAENLFAQTFEGGVEGEYGAVTMIEVFEHLSDPLELMKTLSPRAELIIISTVLVPDPIDDITDWWYLIPDLGQHITFYTPAALAEIADQVGMHVVTNGVNLHVFSRRPLGWTARRVVKDVRFARFVARALRVRDRAKSFSDADAESATAALSRETGQGPVEVRGDDSQT